MDEEPPAKKQMLEEKNITSVQEEIDFSEFTIDQVLLNDVKSKRVHVLGIVMCRFVFVLLFGTKYSKYPFKFFKGCLPQILLGPFLNTLSHLHRPLLLSHFMPLISLYTP